MDTSLYSSERVVLGASVDWSYPLAKFQVKRKQSKEDPVRQSLIFYGLSDFRYSYTSHL